jgi:hypothetical protein
MGKMTIELENDRDGVRVTTQGPLTRVTLSIKRRPEPAAPAKASPVQAATQPESIGPGDQMRHYLHPDWQSSIVPMEWQRNRRLPGNVERHRKA